MLLAVVTSTVQAVATATPTPEVQTVVQYMTPEWVNQLATILKEAATLGLFVVPGYFASFLQSLANRKWPLTRWANASVYYAYSLVLGFLGLVSAGQLDLTKVDLKSPEQVGMALFTVLGAAGARYAVVKAKQGKVATPEVPAQF